MRERNEQINIRVTRNEKVTIKRKARRCGMATGEYMRNCALDRKIIEMPSEGFKLAYRKIGMTKQLLHRYKNLQEEIDLLDEAQAILMDIFHGREVDEDGGDEDLAG